MTAMAATGETGTTDLVPAAAGWSAEALVREHPWPAAVTGPRLAWLWTIDVALPPAALWPLVSDLSRLNRALGNPEMELVERDGRRWGRGRYGGLLHAWEEVAWDWVAGRWFAFDRLYQKGAMTALHAVHRLEPLATGTRLLVYFGVVPRWRVLTPALRARFAALGKAYRRVVPALAAEATSRLTVAPARLPPQAEARVARAADELARAGVEPAVRERLVGLVRGDELDVHRLQVRGLARQWGQSEDAVLRAFLHATRAGLLELTWDVVCPHCRGVRERQTRLAAVPTTGACAACAVEFGTADAVEVGFRIHPAVRAVAARTYCSAEPATRPHVALQRALAPGAHATVELELAPGRYRLRGRGDGPTGSLEVVERGDPATPVTWRSSAPPAEAVPTHAALALVNDTGEPRTFVVEQTAADDLALRPGRVLSDPDFRALFSEEFLADDVRLAVGEQTLLFTDLVGSTAMYADRGDPAAFTVVRRHFQAVFAIVREHRGAVVKTVGDATMAAFLEPVDAVRAAIAIQRRFAAADGLRLRVSINTGPCIAVRLDADIDYFGHAVNVAAKLQALAEGGQVVLAASVAAGAGVGEHLAGAGLAAEDVALVIKGVARPVSAARFTVS